VSRTRLYALVFALTGFAAGSALAFANARRVDSIVISVAERLTPAPCGGGWGELAAVVQGVESSRACLRALGAGRFWVGPLTRVALDSSRDDAIRLRAHVALSSPGLSEALVLGPRITPTLRRAALEALLDDPSTDELWTERAADAGIHGIGDRAAAHRFAGGEPEATRDAAAALRADPHTPELVADVYVGLGTTPGALDEAQARVERGLSPLGLPSTWDIPIRRATSRTGLLLALLAAHEEGAEPDAASPTVPAADAVIDAVYAGDGEEGDHLRAELARAARWITRVPAERRAHRLFAAANHPFAAIAEGAVAVRETGDPHAVLTRAAGSPGVSALVLADLGSATGVPVQIWMAGGEVAARVAGGVSPLGCYGTWAEGGEALSPAAVEALALVEGVGFTLRRGDRIEEATEIAKAARERWPEAPGLDEAEAVIRALSVRPPPPPPPVRRGKRRPPAPAPAPTVQAGLWGFDATAFGSTALLRRAADREQRAHEAAIFAELPALDAAARARVAWWAASAGNTALARSLLAGIPPLDGVDESVRRAALRALGEPAPAPAPAEGCPTAFATYPPL
jgi:hypothetical protein